MSPEDVATIRDAAEMAGQLATTMALATPMLAELREALLRIAPDSTEPLGQQDHAPHELIDS